MSGKAKEDQLQNQSKAMAKILKAIREAHDLEVAKTYKETRDRFIFNMF